MASEVFEIYTSTAGVFKEAVIGIHGALTAFIACSYVCLGSVFNGLNIVNGTFTNFRGESQGDNMLLFGLACVWINTQMYAALSVLDGMKKRKPALLNSFFAVNIISVAIFVILGVLNSESDCVKGEYPTLGIFAMAMLFSALVVKMYQCVLKDS